MSNKIFAPSKKEKLSGVAAEVSQVDYNSYSYESIPYFMLKLDGKEPQQVNQGYLLRLCTINKLKIQAEDVNGESAVMQGETKVGFLTKHFR